MQTIQNFIKNYPITMTVKQIDNRPDNYSGDGFHWVVTLSHDNHTMTVYYTMGYAHCTFKPKFFSIQSKKKADELQQTGYMYRWEKVKDICESYGIVITPKPPTMKDILYCLGLDCRSVEWERDFEGWCKSLGYDPDSRKADHIYNATLQERKDLMQLLGLKGYEALLEVEEE